MEATVPVQTIDALDLRVEPYDWPFLATHRDAITAYWQERVKTLSALHDGRVLLLRQGRVVEKDGRQIFEGTCFETAYSAFLSWRSFGDHTGGIKNIYAMSALQSTDGAFVLGEMAQNTANPGAVYFPAGTPDLEDIKAGKLDMDFNIWRELCEETGLTHADVAAEEGWTFVESGSHAAFFKRMRSPLSAVDLQARIMAHLAKDAAPEFACLHLIRTRADLSVHKIPVTVNVFLEKGL